MCETQAASPRDVSSLSWLSHGGEQVHAVIMPRDGHDVTADELLDHCRHRIAGYRVPKSMSFQDDPLPKSGPGKVLKRVLREPYWEGRDRAI